jgi:2-dehydropantoate 2-reductase
MQITIVGIGAIGGLIAGRLVETGRYDVRALARGATLAALRDRGLTLESGGQTRSLPLTASDDASALGAADLVIIALKAPALAQAAATLRPLIGPRTLVLTAMNGVPWWFMRAAPKRDDVRLESIDPHGSIEATLPADRALGCVVHVSCRTAGPGHVVHVMGDRLIVGEPSGPPGERLALVADALSEGGFTIERSEHVRRELWFKLWGNMTMNPVSALTGATTAGIHADPLVCDFIVAAMAEGAAIGERIGCPIAQSALDRMAITAKLGAFKTSMLQDAEAGRPLELDALLGVVREIGARVGMPTPHLDALYGLTRLMARTRGLWPGPDA